MAPTRIAQLVVVAGCLTASTVAAQDVQNIPVRLQVDRYNCPGDPPGNLGSFDCSFTKTMRAEHFVTSSLTDQAIIGAIVTGAFAHLRNDPPEWTRDVDGLGRRVLSRYERKALGSAAELVVGLAMHSDPRHVIYGYDPRIKIRNGGAWSRIRHAFADWATVRKSAPDALGRRMPNLPLLAGALVNGFAGHYWYPKREATVSRSLLRSIGPLETALLGSFYAEFGTDAMRGLAAAFKRRPAKPPTPRP